MQCVLIRFNLLLLRKGLSVHNGILDAYLDGLTKGSEDNVIIFDILPNRSGFQKPEGQVNFAPMFFISCHWFRLIRYAEFGRAVCERLLAGRSPYVSYLGLLKEQQKDNIVAVEEMVYNHWDASPQAPAKQRPKQELQTPSLSILLWQRNKPAFPQNLLDKFVEGSDQKAEVDRMKKELESLWPTAGTADSAASVVARAAGSPDFTGSTVLDLKREVDLPKTPSSVFSEDKFLGTVCV